jgi:excisionase family DNA binding protein
MRAPRKGTIMPMLSMADVCEEFGLSLTAVRQLIANGELRAFKVGGSVRIRPEDLDKALRPIAPKVSV